MYFFCRVGQRFFVIFFLLNTKVNTAMPKVKATAKKGSRASNDGFFARCSPSGKQKKCIVSTCRRHIHVVKQDKAFPPDVCLECATKDSVIEKLLEQGKHCILPKAAAYVLGSDRECYTVQDYAKILKLPDQERAANRRKYKESLQSKLKEVEGRLESQPQRLYEMKIKMVQETEQTIAKEKAHIDEVLQYMNELVQSLPDKITAASQHFIRTEDLETKKADAEALLAQVLQCTMRK